MLRNDLIRNEKSKNKIFKHKNFKKYTRCKNLFYKMLDFVRKEVIIGSKLLVFGYYGYQYYMYKANDDKKEDLYVPYYDVISTNFSEDVRSAYEKLKAFNENKN